MSKIFKESELSENYKFDKKEKNKILNLSKEIEEDFYRRLNEILCKCESPIERYFLYSIISYGISNCIDISFMDGPFEESIFSCNCSEKIIIDPQKKLTQNIRVDFYLKYLIYVPDFDIERILENEIKIPGTKTITDYLIIECDGHEFHEKTKEQAIKDKKRDRKIKFLGYDVFHFTGSEIYNNATNCIVECIKYIYKKNKLKGWGNV